MTRRPLLQATPTLWTILAAGTTLALCARWWIPAVTGADLWWHLSAGRALAVHQSIPTQDLFSLMFHGQPWANHEWLWQWLHWPLFRHGPNTLAAATLATIAIITFLIFHNSYRASGSRIAAGLATVGAAALCYWFLDIRPHLWTLLWVGVVLAIRTRPWAVWVYPPLILIWVNMHNGFLFGIGMVGLLAVVRTVSHRITAQPERIPVGLWIATAACLLMTVANPTGLDVLAHPFSYLDSESLFRQSLKEWEPPAMGLNPIAYNGRFWLYAAIWTPCAVVAFRRTPYGVLVAAVALAMAATSRRFIPLYAILAAPTVAVGVTMGVERYVDRIGPAWRRGALAVLLVGAWAMAIQGWPSALIGSGLFNKWTQQWTFPEAAVRYLNTLPGKPRMFNHYGWGGYLMFHSPEVPVYIDGRANTVYTEAFFRRYQTVNNAQPGFRRILSEDHIDLVMMPTNSRLSRALGSLAQSWRRIYQDRVADIWVRPKSSLALVAPPIPPELEQHADRTLYRAMTLANKKQFSEAIELFADVIRIDPDMLMAYGYLAVAHGKMGNRDAVAETISLARHRFPNEPQVIGRMAVPAFEAVGDFRTADAMAARIRVVGPFQRAPD